MESETDTNAPAAAVKSLAAIGFITLIAAGIWLAVIAARYIPSVVGSIGSAAVSLSQIFTPDNAGTVATSTPSGEPAATSTPATTSSSTPATTTPATTTPAKPVGGATYPGKQTTGTVPIGASPATPYGLPDLAVTIDATGYLASSTAESFVAATTIPNGMRPAVRFTIRNAGTNVAGPWRFSASLPTQSGFVYQSPIQQVLAPGDRIQYTLGFDQPRYGAGQPIIVIANFDSAIAESNTTNDQAVAAITIIGS